MNRAEAIKIIRETYHTKEELNALETLIPELKESEDEKMFNMVIKAVLAPDARSCIESWGVNPDDVIAYLEKQKELRSAEWNEEDETIRHGIECLIMFALQDGSSIAPGCATTKEQALNWLKSLRPSWKPSEEQMKALLNAEGFLRAGLQYDSAEAIAVLYEQLKQL